MYSYKSTYRNKNIYEDIVVNSTGSHLYTKINGISFDGDNFSELSPGNSNTKLSILGAGGSCSFTCNIPIELEISSALSKKVLLVLTIFLSEKEEIWKLELFHEAEKYTSSGKTGFFESEYIEFKESLPYDFQPKICINCNYSDYSPYGSDSFGSMLCYKNMKNDYQKVHSKESFLEIVEQYDSMVQETYYCTDFLVRQKNVGYRG